MLNAKTELLEHIAAVNSPVEYVSVTHDDYNKTTECSGTLEEVLPKLDFEYDEGYGGQELYGNIWYKDGTWSDREDYDGSEWWVHRERPEIPR